VSAGAVPSFASEFSPTCGKNPECCRFLVACVRPPSPEFGKRERGVRGEEQRALKGKINSPPYLERKQNLVYFI